MPGRVLRQVAADGVQERAEPAAVVPAPFDHGVPDGVDPGAQSPGQGRVGVSAGAGPALDPGRALQAQAHLGVLPEAHQLVFGKVPPQHQQPVGAVGSCRDVAVIGHFLSSRFALLVVDLASRGAVVSAGQGRSAGWTVPSRRPSGSVTMA